MYIIYVTFAKKLFTCEFIKQFFELENLLNICQTEKEFLSILKFLLVFLSFRQNVR